MANKAIPIPKTPLKPGVVAAARRTLVLKAGELEISVEVTAEARPLRTGSAVPIRQLGVKERSDDSRNEIPALAQAGSCRRLYRRMACVLVGWVGSFPVSSA